MVSVASGWSWSRCMHALQGTLINVEQDDVLRLLAAGCGKPVPLVWIRATARSYYTVLRRQMSKLVRPGLLTS